MRAAREIPPAAWHLVPGALPWNIGHVYMRTRDGFAPVAWWHDGGRAPVPAPDAAERIPAAMVPESILADCILLDWRGPAGD